MSRDPRPPSRPRSSAGCVRRSLRRANAFRPRRRPPTKAAAKAAPVPPAPRSRSLAPVDRGARTLSSSCARAAAVPRVAAAGRGGARSPQKPMVPPPVPGPVPGWATTHSASVALRRAPGRPSTVRAWRPARPRPECSRGSAAWYPASRRYRRSRWTSSEPGHDPGRPNPGMMPAQPGHGRPAPTGMRPGGPGGPGALVDRAVFGPGWAWWPPRRSALVRARPAAVGFRGGPGGAPGGGGGFRSGPGGGGGRRSRRRRAVSVPVLAAAAPAVAVVVPARLVRSAVKAIVRQGWQEQEAAASRVRQHVGALVGRC